MSQLSLQTPSHSGRRAARDAPTDDLAGPVLAMAVVLIVIGVVMVFSTGASLDRPFWPDNPMQSPPVRQGVFALTAILGMWLSSLVGAGPLRWRRRDDGSAWHWSLQPAVILLFITLICLGAVLLAPERNGAKRWLSFGPAAYGLGFQPSELAKLTLVLFLSAWLPTIGPRIREFWRGIVPAAGLVGLTAALIGVEDLGTGVLVATIGGLMILAAGARWWHAATLVLPALAGFTLMIVTRDYRLNRLLSFSNIWDDKLGTDYHAIQSLIAIASGGWRGVGIGASMQKLGYLPEARNDFVFAIICEEMGIIGGMAVIGVFMCLCIAGWRIMVRSQNPHGQLLALGITTLIGFQAAMNVAVVTVMVPTKGISLPLISAGGSGLILYGVAIGLLASVGRSKQRID